MKNTAADFFQTTENNYPGTRSGTLDHVFRKSQGAKLKSLIVKDGLLISDYFM
jgi:hypothetical protein